MESNMEHEIGNRIVERSTGITANITLPDSSCGYL